MTTTQRETTTGRAVLAPGSTLVIKLGGATFEGAGAPLEEVAALVRAGMRVVLVHGGGPLITQWLERLGVPTQFQDGVRVTDEPALEVATMVLRGLVNTGVVAGLARHGVSAMGLSGADGGLLRARRRPELGLVGEVEKVDAAELQLLLDRGVVPVIAPLGLDAEGTLLNINADTAASAVAAALGADAALFLTDVPGVCNADGVAMPHLDRAEVERLIAGGVISGGMIPKVRACLDALRGARLAAILDGRTPGALADLLEDAMAGTIVMDRRQETGHAAPVTGDDNAPLTKKATELPAVQAREARVYMHTFHREPLALVRGRGTRVWDDAGRSYLDLVAGVPLGILGPPHPAAAVLLEPIQGEGGVHPAALGYLAAARRLCNERRALLMLDEVQTGMGRTGTFLACQGEDVVPDVVTLAKGLGGGTPLGAALARGTANVFEPGDHGSTLGGNPFSCAAGLATMRVLREEDLVAHAAEVGAYFARQLEGLAARGLPITEVRGRGLVLGLEG